MGSPHTSASTPSQPWTLLRLRLRRTWRLSRCPPPGLSSLTPAQRPVRQGPLRDRHLLSPREVTCWSLRSCASMAAIRVSRLASGRPGFSSLWMALRRTRTATSLRAYLSTIPKLVAGSSGWALSTRLSSAGETRRERQRPTCDPRLGTRGHLQSGNETARRTCTWWRWLTSLVGSACP